MDLDEGVAALIAIREQCTDAQTGRVDEERYRAAVEELLAARRADAEAGQE